MSSLADKLLKGSKSKYIGKASDGLISDVAGFIDSGSYWFNAMLSGSIYGGLASNRITAYCAPSSTGKTYFALEACRYFLENNPEGCVYYFDTESAIDSKQLDSRNIDKDRFVMSNPSTVEEFKYEASNLLKDYEEIPLKEREKQPLMIVLDSLGQLSSKKELEDTLEGKDKVDMTRAKQIKATFRVLSLDLGRLNVPMVVTNHVYEKIGGMFPEQISAGGTGLTYSTSTMCFFSKAKDKNGTEVVGNIITATAKKSRLTRENSKAKIKLDYSKGLDRWYGMDELAVASGAWKKSSTRIELPDGTKKFAKKIMEEPEKYFTDDIMETIDEYCKKRYMYQSEDSETINSSDSAESIDE